MIGYVYGNTSKYHAPFVAPCYNSFVLENQLSANQSLGVKVATPVGNLVGQLLFGWLADVLGRKRMCRSSYLRYIHLH